MAGSVGYDRLGDVDGTRIRAAHFPAGFENDKTSFIGLLRGAVSECNVEPVDGLTLAQCARFGRERVDVVHLHWLEFLVRPDTAGVLGLARTLVRVGRFCMLLLLLRLRAVAVVWSVHNLRPHESDTPAFDYVMGAMTLRLCDRAIAHSRYARKRIVRRYGPSRKVKVIPVGNYVDVYSGYKQLDTVRRQVAARGSFVYLCFGQIRPYKQLVALVEAFRLLSDDTVRLIIAGQPVVAEEVERLRAAAANDPRVELDLRLIPDDEVSALHRRADVAVFAYRDVFSSAALLLALSYGLPVVAPGGGTATEMVPAPGIEAYGAGGLATALERIRHGDMDERRRAAIAAAEACPWSLVGAETAEVYREVIGVGAGARGG